MEKITNK